MQNSQEINWLAILAPSLIVGLFTIIVQILLAYWLSRITADYQKKISEKLEDYKKDISKELENHKIQLQSDFQTKLYEFQTRFSYLHQQRAKIIQQLFEMLVELENDLEMLGNDDVFELMGLKFSVQDTLPEDYKQEAFTRLRDKCFELHSFSRKKRIFISEEILERLEKLQENIEKSFITHYISREVNNPKTKHKFLFIGLDENQKAKKSKEMAIEAQELLKSVLPVMRSTEQEFRKFFFEKSQNNQLEKKQ